MKITLLFLLLLFSVPLVASSQVVHPLSNPDLLFGKVAQVKEIYYPQPKAGEKIDTLEKRITWYDGSGNTDDIKKFKHTKKGWIDDPNVFTIRLKKFGTPPITTGKDSLDFTIKYDSLGHEVERENYSVDGKLASRMLFFYNAAGGMVKSEMYSNNNELFSTTTYFYLQDRLVSAKIVFPNHTAYNISYKYEGADMHNNWLKRVVSFYAGNKLLRAEVTERRVIVYP